MGGRSVEETTNACDFECNICLELAHDPIVTPCGHLYCWSCMYKWLYYHSQSNDCPVCKSLILEQKLVPIFGRGKTSQDPRSRPVIGISVPNRPSVQRPAVTASINNNNNNNGYFWNNGLGYGFRFGGILSSLTRGYEEPYHVDMDRMRHQVHDLLCKTVLLGIGFLILFIYIDYSDGVSK